MIPIARESATNFPNEFFMPGSPSNKETFPPHYRRLGGAPTKTLYADMPHGDGLR
jgi:hypothetical protein